MFGSLVAAVAKGGELPAGGTHDTADEATAAQPDATSDMPPAFVVRQWLAQTESLPSFSKGLVSLLEKFSGGKDAGPETTSVPTSESEEPLPNRGRDVPPEFLVPPKAMQGYEHRASELERVDISAPEFAAPVTQLASQNAIDSDIHPENELEKTGIRVPNHDRSKSDHDMPSEDFALAALAASAHSHLSHPHQNIAGSDVPPPNAQVRNGNAPLPDRSEPPSTPPFVSTLTRPANEIPFGRQRQDGHSVVIGDSTERFAERTSDQAGAILPDQPRPTQGADRLKAPEQNSAPPQPARASERLPQLASNTQANSPANPPTQMPDSLAVPPPTTNVSPSIDTSAEAPVKLALTARPGEQTSQVQTLAFHIAARSSRGDSRFTIRIDPPELGRIDVNLTMNSHGHAQAVLAVEKPQTLELLLRDAPALERALKDAGLELGSSLSFSLKEDGRPHFAREEHDRPPSHAIRLTQADAMNISSPLNSSLLEHLYDLRVARLDITV